MSKNTRPPPSRDGVQISLSRPFGLAAPEPESTFALLSSLVKKIHPSVPRFFLLAIFRPALKVIHRPGIRPAFPRTP